MIHLDAWVIVNIIITVITIAGCAIYADGKVNNVDMAIPFKGSTLVKLLIVTAFGWGVVIDYFMTQEFDVVELDVHNMAGTAYVSYEDRIYNINKDFGKNITTDTIMGEVTVAKHKGSLGLVSKQSELKRLK